MSGDLHCYTRLSNGSMSIDETIALAKSVGVEVISITDRDTYAGVVRAKLVGERNDIKVLPGVEFSAIDKDTGEVVYVLCYLPEFPERLEGLCHRNTTARRRAAQYMMLKVAQRYPVSIDLIKRCATGSNNIFKQHIMQGLMECGVADSLYGKLYNELFLPESDNNVLMKPAFASLEEVIEAIHSACGIAVLANAAVKNNSERIEKCIQMGVDGIEIWHPFADEDITQELALYAKKKGLLTTGGSCFRGMYNLNVNPLGAYQTPKTQLSELLNYKSKKKRLLKKSLAAE